MACVIGIDVGMSGQMHGLVLLECHARVRQGSPVRKVAFHSCISQTKLTRLGVYDRQRISLKTCAVPGMEIHINCSNG